MDHAVSSAVTRPRRRRPRPGAPPPRRRSCGLDGGLVVGGLVRGHAASTAASSAAASSAVTRPRRRRPRRGFRHLVGGNAASSMPRTSRRTARAPSSADGSEPRQRPHPEPGPPHDPTRIHRAKGARIGRGGAVVSGEEESAVEVDRGDPLDHEPSGLTGVGNGHDLAGPGGPSPIGVRIDEQPVALLDGRVHAAAFDGHPRSPRTDGPSRAGSQRGERGRGQDADPQAGTETTQEGRPPLVAQKMSAMAATWASRSAAAAASTDCLQVPACLSAFQNRPWRSGCCSRCSGLK